MSEMRKSLRTREVELEIKSKNDFDLVCSTDKKYLYESLYVRGRYYGTTAFDKKEQMLTILSDKRFSKKDVLEHCEIVRYRTKSINKIGEDVEKKFLKDDRHTHVQKVLRRRAEANYQKKAAKNKEIFKNIKPITKAFDSFLEKDVFQSNEYRVMTHMFFDETHGYCTYCKKDVQLKEKPKHLAIGKCPHCKTTVRYQSVKRRRKCIEDRASGVLIEKHEKDVFCARFFVSYRYFHSDYRNPSIYKHELVRVFISPDSTKAYAMKRNDWTDNNTDFILNGWNQDGYMFRFVWNLDGKVYEKNHIKKALADSFLAKSGIVEYMDNVKERCKKGYDVFSSSVGFMVNYINNPNYRLFYEYLSKSGFDLIAGENARDLRMAGSGKIDCSKRTLPEMLCVDRMTYRKLLEVKGDVTLGYLKIAQELPAAKANEWDFLHKNHISTDCAKAVMRYMTLHKANKYLDQLISKDKESYSPTSKWFGVYRDYLNLLESEGEMDRKNSFVMFPRYLKDEHDRLLAKKTSRKNKEKEDKRTKHNKIIASMFDEVMKRFSYTDDSYSVIAPRSGEMIEAEGKTLHICVGNLGMSYIERMAERKDDTNILFVRDSKMPEKPLYTMEIYNNRIAQVRGYGNCSPSVEAKAFISKFAKAKKLQCAY